MIMGLQDCAPRASSNIATSSQRIFSASKLAEAVLRAAFSRFYVFWFENPVVKKPGKAPGFL